MHRLMRRIAPAVLAASAAIALVVLADPAVRAPSATTTSASSAHAGTTQHAAASTHRSSSGATSSMPGAAAKTTTTGPITGPVVQTQWGPVQVVASITNGNVTAADAVMTPDSNGQSMQINSYAVPVLNSEAIRAGSAQIDAISGATVTSNGYRQSLQAILDGHP